MKSIAFVIALSSIAATFGCRPKAFQAFKGPIQRESDFKLVIVDPRVRIVRADQIDVPPAFAEVESGVRELWLRPGSRAAVELVLGIAPHPVVMGSSFKNIPDISRPPGSALAPGMPMPMRTIGASTLVRYPGSKMNQRVSVPVAPGLSPELYLVGGTTKDGKTVWGFIVQRDEKTHTLAKRLATEQNRAGGTDATPWTMKDLPDDAFEVKSTIYH